MTVEALAPKLNLALELKTPIPEDVYEFSVGSTVRGFLDSKSTKSLGWLKVHKYFDDIGADINTRLAVIEELRPFSGLKFLELKDRLMKNKHLKHVGEGSLAILNALFGIQLNDGRTSGVGLVYY